MEEKYSQLRSILSEKKLDAVIISSVPTIIHLTGYAGFSLVEREAFMLITRKNQYLFTDARYSEAVRVEIPDIILNEISAATPITVLIKEIVDKDALQRVGFEDNNMTVAEYTKLKKVFPTFSPVNLRTVRMKKNQYEIAAVQKACEIGDKAFSAIQDKINPGMTELEVARELEFIIRNLHATLSFPTIVAFGKNAAVPHHHTGKTRLQKKDIILLDFGVKYDNFCSDMTRTIFLGAPTDEQRKAYEIVLAAQQKAVAYLEKKIILSLPSSYKGKGIPSPPEGEGQGEGVKASEVDKIARKHIISQGYPSIPHSLGHGIGIEVHEAPSLSPKSRDTLEEGMVFSIEPGIYLPGHYGIRIEDLFAIQDHKLVKLTNADNSLRIL